MSQRLTPGTLPPVTEDEALEHMLHHLQLAHCYFMNVADNLPSVLAEVRRMLVAAKELQVVTEVQLNWVTKMFAVFEDMKDDD